MQHNMDRHGQRLPTTLHGLSFSEGHDLTYLLLDVVQGVRGIDGEADQDDMRVGVGERAETVVILLASRIPQGQLNVLAIDLDIGDIVLENSGNVDLAAEKASANYKFGRYGQKTQVPVERVAMTIWAYVSIVTVPSGRLGR